MCAVLDQNYSHAVAELTDQSHWLGGSEVMRHEHCAHIVEFHLRHDVESRSSLIIYREKYRLRPVCNDWRNHRGTVKCRNQHRIVSADSHRRQGQRNGGAAAPREHQVRMVKNTGKGRVFAAPEHVPAKDWQSRELERRLFCRELWLQQIFSKRSEPIKTTVGNRECPHSAPSKRRRHALRDILAFFASLDSVEGTPKSSPSAGATRQSLARRNLFARY